MDKCWIVRNNKERAEVTKYTTTCGSNNIDFEFFNYYLKDLIKDRDTALIPNRIIFHLDNEPYAMMYIMDAFHKIPLSFFDYAIIEFHSNNKILVQTYERIVENMKKHTY